MGRRWVDINERGEWSKLGSPQEGQVWWCRRECWVAVGWRSTSKGNGANSGRSKRGKFGGAGVSFNAGLGCGRGRAAAPGCMIANAPNRDDIILRDAVVEVEPLIPDHETFVLAPRRRVVAFAEAAHSHKRVGPV